MHNNATYLFVMILAMAGAGNALGAASVDPALVGTWQLEYPGPPAFWAIRNDGVYRIHGPQTPNTAHRGQMRAAAGAWELNSPQWQDSGTYQLSDNDTWVTVGKLGPGTWRRVWTPQRTVATVAPTTPACALLSPNEVAQVLAAPATDGTRQGGPEEGCRYNSRLNDNDSLRLFMSHGSTTAESYQRKRQSASEAIDVTGVGRAAFATVSRSGDLSIQVLGDERVNTVGVSRTGTLFELTLKLSPEATAEDLAALSALARLAYQRWGGKSPPGSR